MQSKLYQSLAQGFQEIQKAFANIDLRRSNRCSQFSLKEKTLRTMLNRKIQKDILKISQKLLFKITEQKIDQDLTLTTVNTRVTIRTALIISAELRTATRAAIRAITGAQTAVIFKTSPQLICGIELGINEQRVTWTVADFLSLIEHNAEDQKT